MMPVLLRHFLNLPLLRSFNFNSTLGDLLNPFRQPKRSCGATVLFKAGSYCHKTHVITKINNVALLVTPGLGLALSDPSSKVIAGLMEKTNDLTFLNTSFMGHYHTRF